MARPGPTLLVLSSFLALAFAGCLQAPDAALTAQSAAVEGAPWTGLATFVETPEGVPTRSAAERRADVVPPGDPRYAAFDALVARFMATHDVTAATVAALKGGQLRYAQGYGHLDENATAPTPPDAMLRIASVTKPMTAAVVAHLVEEGRMAWDDPVFCLPPTPAANCLLPIDPHPKRPVQDARLADVTLRDLVVHRSGWTRAACTAPIISEVQIGIAAELGTESPPPRWRLAQWFMGTPMEYDPGTDPDGFDTYCNMAYMILGLVAEARTGATMEALYDAYLWRPLEVVGDVEAGRSRPADRNPREPNYACDLRDYRDAYDPSRYGCASETSIPLEPILAVGGLVATAEAVGAVYEVYANDGHVRDPAAAPVDRSGHSGGLAGTSTMARRTTVAGVDLQVVVLLNSAAGYGLLVADTNSAYRLLQSELLGVFAAIESAPPLPHS